jgi:serine/threonine-protein kinase HipA
MKKNGLNVFAGRVLAGRLERSDRDENTSLFTYDGNCTATSAVSITMPVRADQYDSMSGLLPIFEMNLPEGILRERLRLQFAKAIPKFDDLDLLSIVGASQIGRLRYTTKPIVEEAVPAQDLGEILTYKGSADLFAHLLERFASYSGVSGVQPKVLVRDADVPNKFVEQGATHIVKAFDSREFPELAANEMICTHGAAAAGIKTSSVQLSENRKFLVVDRFDLTNKGEYLGIEDFCVLDGRRAHGRYDGSYEGIGRRIADFVSPAVLAEAREQFALMVAYACAVGNGDAHLKNFSVLYDDPEGTVSLAPAYDVVSTVPYFPRETLALSLDGSKQFPERARLIRFIRHTTGKGQKFATELLHRVEVGVMSAIERADSFRRDSKSVRRFADRLIESMQAGLERMNH